jgi:HEAT repeat protein
MLLDLADDPVPVVACQALWALGQRKDRQTIPEIVERIDASSHWYIQMYAYRALRTLGWVQPQSPQVSY